MRVILWLFLLVPALVFAEGNPAIQAELKKLAWQDGPSDGRIGDKATIKVPAGFVFLDEKNTRRFLEIAGNPPRDRHYLIAPNTLAWFAVFSFNATGYVKDDEKIDPDAILGSLKASDSPGNEERKKLGLPALYTEGWAVAPHFDSQTKRLEWGVKLRSDPGGPVVNYTSRLLGRTGVMSALLVSDPATLAADTQQFRSALQSFDYVAGEKYSEFKSGDKIAEYGLAALILGGAAAVATKKGLWAVIAGFLAAFWKLILGVVVAAMAGFRSIFKSKKT